MTPRIEGQIGWAFVAGRRCEIVNLSITGVQLRVDGNHSEFDDISTDTPYRLDLLLGSAPAGTWVRVTGVIRWRETDAPKTVRIGFQFIDAEADAVDVIDRLVASRLASEPVTADLPGTAARNSSVDVPPVARRPDAVPNVPPVRQRPSRILLWRWFAAVGAMTGIGALLLFSLYNVGDAVFGVRATYAAITVETETLRAPATGTVFWEPHIRNLTDGRFVREGSTVGRLEPTVNPVVLASVEPRIAQLEARLRELADEETVVAAAIATQSARTRDVLRIIQDRLSDIRMEIQELVSTRHNIEELAQRNLVTTQRLEQISSLLSERRTTLTELLREERRLQAQAEELASGRLVSDERAIVRSIEAVRRERAGTSAELDAARALLDRLSAAIPLVVRHDATALQRLVDHGMTVQLSDPILRLAREGAGAEPRLQALLPVTQARHLQRGDPASVAHGPTGSVRRAIVTRIVYTPESDLRYGLPSLRTLGYEAALVDLTPVVGHEFDMRPGEAIAVHFPIWPRLFVRVCSRPEWPESLHAWICSPN